jgi:small-conductance mechanosensitive channel
MANDTVIETVASGTNTINSFLAGGIVGNIILAVIILLIGLILGRIAGKLVTKLLGAVEIDLFAKKAGIKLKFEYFLGNLVSYIIYLIAVLMALDQIGIRTFVLQILAVAALILLLLSVVLSLRDFLPNFFAGAFAVKGKIIDKGDRIRIHDIEGKVESLGMSSLRVKTKKGDRLFIPYSHLVKSDFAVKRKK